MIVDLSLHVFTLSPGTGTKSLMVSYLVMSLSKCHIYHHYFKRLKTRCPSCYFSCANEI